MLVKVINKIINTHLQTPVCESCGSLLGPVTEMASLSYEKSTKCRLCGNEDSIKNIEVPYIFRYLVTQLASCNINIKLQFKKV